MSGRLLLAPFLLILPVVLLFFLGGHEAYSREARSDEAQSAAGELVLTVADWEQLITPLEAHAQKLRDQGPASLEKALRFRDALTQQLAASKNTAEQSKLKLQLQRLNDIIDRVGQQLHGHISRLYWYTNIEQAQKAAQQSGKPILSLRLLGKLTDECSCANSRFFRTALYSNRTISSLLREKFVLHWETVRPVPVITIDFGDGRVVRRTITGNSAHYLLDANGRPLDVLPGLYGPAAFEKWLQGSLVLASDWRQLQQGDQQKFLASYHQTQKQALEAAFVADLKAIGYSKSGAAKSEGSPKSNSMLFKSSSLLLSLEIAPPTAQEAAVGPIGKGLLEIPIVNAITLHPRETTLATTTKALDLLDHDGWAKIAALHADESFLDLVSRELIRKENPTATQASRLSRSKSKVEDPLVRVIRKFQTSMALDSVRNEYLLHRQIHDWFVEGSSTQERQALNERIYAELFLTPSSDPWLGLIPADAYSALPNNGLIQKKANR